MNKDYLFNSIIDSYIENFSDVDLIDGIRNYNDYIDIKETFQIVGDFLKDYDEDIYNIFINIVNNTPDRFRIYSSEISNEYANYSDPVNNQIAITPKYTIEDAYVIVHELYHYIDSTKNKVKNNLIYSETSSMTMELYLFRYLMQNNIHSLDSYNYIHNLFFRNTYDVYYYKYCEFKSKNINLFKTITKGYPIVIKEEINKLDDKYKDVFLKHYKDFDKRLKKDGLLSAYYLKRNFSYSVGLFLSPYLLAKKDKDLIVNINKASYDDNVDVPKFNVNEVCAYYKKFSKTLSKMGQKYPKYLRKYESNEFNKLIYKLISNVPDNFEYKINSFKYYIDLNTSMEIVRNFLEWFDPNLLNMFNNIISFDRHSVHFNIVDYDDSSNAKNSFMLLDTGEIVYRMEQNISDVFTILHEFIHRIDYTKIYCFDYILDKNEMANYSEIAPITMELYLYDYLIDIDYCKEDVVNYMSGLYAFILDKAYFQYFVNLILKKYNINFYDISLKTVSKDQFIKDIENIPNNIKNRIINRFEIYMQRIETYQIEGNIKEDINKQLLYNYAFFIAPYLKNKNDIDLINKINRASYNIEDDVNYIDDSLIIRDYNKFLNDLMISRNKLDKDNSHEKI